MEAPPFLRLPSEHGERFSGVFRFGRLIETDLLEATLVGTDHQVLFNQHIHHELFTVYDAVVLAMEPCFLALDDQSRLVPYDGPYPQSLIKEACAGMGGLGLGASMLGYQVVAALDSNQLACAHLELNEFGNGNILCRDLCDDSAKGDLHVAGGVCASTLTAGFPCQPHSAQRRGAGFMDPRHQVFTEVLRTAYLHVVDCLVLECTPQAQFDQGVRQRLIELARIMGWQIHETTLALSHQWPCRRHRWWAILCSSSWQSTTLLKWPMATNLQQVGEVLPHWGSWPFAHEQALQLTPVEQAAYASMAFGTDKRLLEHSDMAPTFLHPYGCALVACPCGCRLHPFTDATLRQRGLRGCYVISTLLHQPRFLHPVELAALLGFPATMSHLPSLRGALLGSVASPLQALWVFACLTGLTQQLSPAETLDLAQTTLMGYKTRLLNDLMPLFGSSVSVPRSLQLQAEDGPVPLRIAGLITVAQLLRAHAGDLQPGQFLTLWDGPRQLPDHQILLQQGAHGPYTLCIQGESRPSMSAELVLIAFDYQSRWLIAVVSVGDFLFQALAQCGIPTTMLCHTAEGQILTLDSRLWESSRLYVVEDLAPSFQMAFGASWTFSHGLTDVQIWQVMQAMILSNLPNMDSSVAMVHPLQAWQLLQDPSHFLGGVGESEVFSNVFCIFVSRGHWALLWGHHALGRRQWTLLDGLSTPALADARRLALALSAHLDEPFDGLRHQATSPQHHGHTCGTVALWHLFCILHGPAPLTPSVELHLHDCIQGLVRPGGYLHGLGRTPAEVQERLRQLLVDKGVPEPDSEIRATDVLKTLGSSAVSEALSASNAWLALKTLASRPPTRMRLIKDYELKAHINQQASSKHGAQVPRAKQKKHASSTAALPPVDPASLQLVPNTFVDDDGDELPQIPFSEVGKDAHGLAFCTQRQAQPFIDATDYISSTTLGLLITTEVQTGSHFPVNLGAIQFPALCLATGEPMLIQGSLLTLSNGAIHRKEDQATDLQVSSTAIIKIQLHRDELSIDWSQVTHGPIRALLQLAPSFRLCSGRQCGAECPLYHPPIDEELPGLILDIWARNFCNMNGKTTKAGQAAYFQALIRIPSVALE